MAKPRPFVFAALLMMPLLLLANASLAAQPLQTVDIEATRRDGPSVAPSGSSRFTMTEQDILDLPSGENSGLSDVLAQMPGVSIDQNQQIHIRDTEGPQFQYRIDGVMVPLDINTNPPFLSMLNAMIVGRIDLLTGVLPARYSYATGGVVDIRTKRGCDGEAAGARPTNVNLSVYAGGLDTLQPSIEYRGCTGRFGYYVSGLYARSNEAFSSATPGPEPYHDRTRSAQTFAVADYAPSDATKLTGLLSPAASDNPLRYAPGRAPQATRAGAAAPPSQDIDSYLDFRDALLIVALDGKRSDALTWRLADSFHTITQAFRPDDAAELIYEGVASTATHRDIDNALQGDVAYRRGSQTLEAGFYVGAYSADIRDDSRVFPVDASGAQAGSLPLEIASDAHALNWLSGFYLDDLWTIDARLSADLGVRWDKLTGFTAGSQFDPTVNLNYRVDPDTTLHGGFARAFQVPLFQGISPTAPSAFARTTAAGPPGAVSPVTEDDSVWDVGVLHHLTARLTVSEDNYYERTRHYLDTGQFGVVPIFAPFNYRTGYLWGSELGAAYRRPALSAYLNVTLGRNLQKGVSTGQFNFDPEELAFIDGHYIDLDHQPLVGASAGVNEEWREFKFGVDGLFSSGLRGGFADQRRLPHVLQINASVERSFLLPGIGTVTDRLTLINVFDRVNLIRPAQGIGIFQAAYGSRFTIYDTLTVSL